MENNLKPYLLRDRSITMVEAVKTGKDDYVEKHLTQTILAGRTMVNVWKASNQVVAVGLNRRGNTVYKKLAKEYATLNVEASN